MSDIYKLQYNGMTLAYPGWNGYVGYENAPVYTLTLETDGHGTLSAETLTGYEGDTVTLSPTYNTYYRFSSYECTGGTIEGNTYTFGNQNATAKANFKLNSFTARGNLQWTNNFNGSYQGVADAYPSLQITGWTGTVASSTMTGGEGTNYGATGTSKANNMKAAYHKWKSFTNWKSTSLKAPVNCSAWKLSAHMNITGHRNVTSIGIFCGASERAVTAQACINGTGTGRSSVSTNSWFPTSKSNKTTAYDLTATAAKYGTATNLGSYGVHFAASNYGTVGNGSGSCGSWAYHRVIGCNGTWLASGIMP